MTTPPPSKEVALLRQMPFEVPVAGRVASLTLSSRKRVRIVLKGGVGDCKESFERWMSRKGIGINGPEERENFRLVNSRVEGVDSVPAFLKWFIRQPIGLPLLIFPGGSNPYQLLGRQTALDEAYYSWDAAHYWSRASDGRLELAMPCIGFRSNVAKHHTHPDEITRSSLETCLCSANVRNPDGSCASHSRSTSRSLFNWYPFFERELEQYG